jgi:hypothetical protein
LDAVILFEYACSTMQGESDVKDSFHEEQEQVFSFRFCMKILLGGLNTIVRRAIIIGKIQ